MLYMSAPVATSAINTNRTKVVGTGLTLKSTIDRDVLGLTPEAAKEWQTKAEAEFRLWAENRRNCDAMGLNNFYGLQQLALKSWLMSGDVFAVVKIRDVDKLHPYALRLHLVEADRVSTPNRYGSAIDILGYTVGKNPDNGNKILDGVEVDSSGAVVAYHIRNTYPHEWLNSEETVWQRVEVVGKRPDCPKCCTSWNRNGRTSTAAFPLLLYHRTAAPAAQIHRIRTAGGTCPVVLHGVDCVGCAQGRNSVQRNWQRRSGRRSC